MAVPLGREGATYLRSVLTSRVLGWAAERNASRPTWPSPPCTKPRSRVSLATRTAPSPQRRVRRTPGAVSRLRDPIGEPEQHDQDRLQRYHGSTPIDRVWH